MASADMRSELLLHEFETVQIKEGAVGGDSSIIVYFTVKCPTIREWERMFLTGSNEQLGRWLTERAIEMDKCDFGDNGGSIWKASLRLNSAECKQHVRFRYFVGYYLQATVCPSTKAIIVAKWESQRSARKILPSVEAINGKCRERHVDEFGCYGGREVVCDEWLSNKNQHQVQFRLYGYALKFFLPRFNNVPVSVKLTAFDLRHKANRAKTSALLHCRIEAFNLKEFTFAENGKEGTPPWRLPSLYVSSIGSNEEEMEAAEETLPAFPSFSNTDVVNLCSDDPFYHSQAPCGEFFKNDGDKDYLSFRTTTLAIEHLGFRVEFFRPANRVQPTVDSSRGSTRFALAYCMPSSMQDTNGVVTVPVLATKNQQPIGQLTIDYLIVSALNGGMEQTMEISFAKHWKKRRKALEIGHRGWGDSYTKLAATRENTIHSLNQAVLHGADFVEFDVQLTKDRVAIIFHDFHLLISVARRSQPSSAASNLTQQLTNSIDESTKNLETDYHELAVKDLKLEQLRLLHVHHHTALEAGHGHETRLRVSGTSDESPEMNPFPTLLDVLNKVDEHAGFNIEMKYSMRTADGKHECENYFERNSYVDIILNDVLRCGGNRRIVFSSFDPDICSMVALKQTRYPVIFLSVGATNRYVPYVDKRSCSSTMAVNFAASSQLLGVNFHSEDLLADPTSVSLARKRGLVCFVWGDDLEDSKCIDYFRGELALDGIIYDRIGEAESRQNVFVVEKEVRSTLFRSPSPSRTSSMDKSTLDLSKPATSSNQHRCMRRLGQLQSASKVIFQSQAIDML